MQATQIVDKERPMVGSWINTASPIVAELMSQSGFDFLVVDAEHSMVSVSEVQALFMAIRAGNRDCVPMVRMPGNDYALTKRYLDAGARGIICPFVKTAADARALVRAAKYPPEGERGVGFARANDYGLSLNHALEHDNDETFVCAQIEHVDAVENLDEILAVPGVDATILGPYDLSASMGIAGEFDNRRFVEARNRVLDGCRRRGVLAGIHVVQPCPSQVRARISEGFGFIAYSLDLTMLSTACREGLASIREGWE